MDILKAREKAKKLKKKEEKTEVLEEIKEEKEKEIEMGKTLEPPEGETLLKEKEVVIFEEKEKEREEVSFIQLAEEELEHAFAEEKVFEEGDNYLIFTLGGENYAVRLDELKEVIVWKPITQVPNAPEFVEGIISLRGRIVPIVEINKKLSIPFVEDVDSQRRRIVLVETEGKEFGFSVDAIKGVKNIPRTRLESPPSTIGNINKDYISYFVHMDGEFIAVLNISKIVEIEK